MNWTRSLVATAAVASCLTAFAANRASAAPAPQPAPATLADGSGDYTIKTAASGAGIAVTISVTSKWHINKAYPLKFNAKPVAAGNLAFAGPAESPSSVTVSIPDAKSGTVKFGYCASDGSACSFGSADVKL